MRSYSSAQPKPPAASMAPPKVEIGPEFDARGRPDWSRYNASIVGAKWDEKAPLHPAALPGLAEATARGKAAQAAYLASRNYYNYKDDESGWVHVKRGGKKTKRQPTREAYSLTDE